MRTRGIGGFTLFEVLGVILVTTLLLGVALDFYIDLSREAQRASENTRQVRRATAILDRVADDLERTLLVRKRPEEDPLTHPWVFRAEGRYAPTGSDRLEFVIRQRPRSTEGPVETLAVVYYALLPSEDGEAFELRRQSRPGLPDRLEPDFPLDGEPEQFLVADGIQHFSARFLGEEGEWLERWDSSQLLESAELPTAVELELALAGPETSELDLVDGAPRYTRQVQLPVRPLDLQALLSEEPGDEDGDAYGEGEGDDAELAGKTVADCVDFAQIADLDLRSALMEQAESVSFLDYRGALEAYAYAIRPECR